MDDLKQTDLFGGEVDWDDADQKAQKKHSRPLIQRDNLDRTDNEILQWMRRLDYAVSVDELADRLKPVGFGQGTVANSMRRLRKNRQIISHGEEDPNCEQHKVLSNFRWIPAQ